jgi:hypothetical protein
VVAAAAAVMAAVYFVPSASATQEDAPAARTGAVTDAGSPDELADTGAMNTKPYLIGGSGFLVVGAGLLVNAARRSRQEAEAAEEPEADS